MHQNVVFSWKIIKFFWNGNIRFLYPSIPSTSLTSHLPKTKFWLRACSRSQCYGNLKFGSPVCSLQCCFLYWLWLCDLQRTQLDCVYWTGRGSSDPTTPAAGWSTSATTRYVYRRQRHFRPAICLFCRIVDTRQYLVGVGMLRCLLSIAGLRQLGTSRSSRTDWAPTMTGGLRS